MDSISVEQKLELLRQLREEQSKNQAKLQNRTSILYGNSTYHPPVQSKESESELYYPKSTLKLRLIFSILILVCVLAMNYFDRCIFNLDAQSLDTWIEEEKILTEDFYEQISLKP